MTLKKKYPEVMLELISMKEYAGLIHFEEKKDTPKNEKNCSLLQKTIRI